jgi:hypothetical protein
MGIYVCLMVSNGIYPLRNVYIYNYYGKIHHFLWLNQQNNYGPWLSNPNRCGMVFQGYHTAIISPKKGYMQTDNNMLLGSVYV